MQVRPTSFLTLSEMLQADCSDSRIRKAIKHNFAADDFFVEVKVKTIRKNHEVEGKILDSGRFITISQGPRSVLSKIARTFTCCLGYHDSPPISDDEKEVISRYVLESRLDKPDEDKKGRQLLERILRNNQTLFITAGKSKGADAKSFRIIEPTASC